MLLTGKSALITGAAHRLGAKIARTLHENGANLIIHYRHSEEAAKALAKQLNDIRNESVRILQADLNDFDAVSQLADSAINAFNRLDILINNASEFHPTPIGSIKLKHWEAIMNSNCRAPLFLSQACAPALRQQNGVIINMLDIYASAPLLNHSLYCSAKAASQMLVKSLALELSPEIRVSGIAPGAILWADSNNKGDPEAQQAILRQIPLQRSGDSESIAKAVLFIIDNDYLTGEIIRIDGGRLLNSF
ncbi:MAG: pteridine reductase [Gammaproteobacteria bacterium]|nr:pteridine reductase [Gammaproteobacteria bacterium]